MTSRFDGSSFDHGSRAAYVRGCRCAECRAANVAAYHERQAWSKTAALEAPTRPPIPIVKTWTRPDGSTARRTYKGCPGVAGDGCPKGRHLRKDSTGGLCGDCRGELVWNGLVPAGPTWKLLDELVAEYFTQEAVAELLGYRSKALQIGRRRVLATTHQRVARLHEKLIGREPLDR